MTIPELYNLTLIHEALVKNSSEVSLKDIDFVYKSLPTKYSHKLNRKEKIKMILSEFERISTETLQRYLIDKQLKDEEKSNESCS